MNNLQVQKIINEVVRIVNYNQEVGNPVERVFYLPMDSAAAGDLRFIIQYKRKATAATEE